MKIYYLYQSTSIFRFLETLKKNRWIIELPCFTYVNPDLEVKAIKKFDNTVPCSTSGYNYNLVEANALY